MMPKTLKKCLWISIRGGKAMNFNIYPAIDIRGGKCVRLYQGDYDQENIYYDNPIDAAIKWKESGTDWLHIVDLDGAREASPVNLSLIKELIEKTGLKVQIGGGIRDLETAKAYLDIGATRVILGSVALSNPEIVEEIINAYGSDRVVVSLDGRKDKVAGEGWLVKTEKDLFEVAESLVAIGVDNFIYTDIERDGTLNGPNIENTLELAKKAGKNIIVAGGVSSEADVFELSKYKDQGIEGVIIGRAIYTGDIDLENLLKNIKPKRIIPCLDVKDGRVVKGINFVDIKDAGDPVELAQVYDQEGADELVVLDISASVEGRKTILDVVEQIAEKISIPLIIGGGINSLEDIENVLNAGASKISLNTAAVTNPDLIKAAAEKFGSNSVVVAIDTKYNEEKDIHEVYTHGGTKVADFDLVEWAKKVQELGAGEILLTSMDQDGKKNGFDLELLDEVCNNVFIPVIASGGAGKKEDFYEAFTKTKTAACLAASIFHYQETTIMKIKEYLNNKGVVVKCQ